MIAPRMDCLGATEHRIDVPLVRGGRHLRRTHVPVRPPCVPSARHPNSGRGAVRDGRRDGLRRARPHGRPRTARHAGGDPRQARAGRRRGVGPRRSPARGAAVARVPAARDGHLRRRRGHALDRRGRVRRVRAGRGLRWRHHRRQRRHRPHRRRRVRRRHARYPGAAQPHHRRFDRTGRHAHARGARLGAQGDRDQQPRGRRPRRQHRGRRGRGRPQQQQPRECRRGAQRRRRVRRVRVRRQRSVRAGRQAGRQRTRRAGGERQPREHGRGRRSDHQRHGSRAARDVHERGPDGRPVPRRRHDRGQSHRHRDEDRLPHRRPGGARGGHARTHSGGERRLHGHLLRQRPHRVRRPRHRPPARVRERAGRRLAVLAHPDPQLRTSDRRAGGPRGHLRRPHRPAPGQGVMGADRDPPRRLCDGPPVRRPATEGAARSWPLPASDGARTARVARAQGHGGSAAARRRTTARIGPPSGRAESRTLT